MQQKTETGSVCFFKCPLHLHAPNSFFYLDTKELGYLIQTNFFCGHSEWCDSKKSSYTLSCRDSSGNWWVAEKSIVDVDHCEGNISGYAQQQAVQKNQGNWIKSDYEQ